MIENFVDRYPISTAFAALGCGFVLGLTVSTKNMVRGALVAGQWYLPKIIAAPGTFGGGVSADEA